MIKHLLLALILLVPTTTLAQTPLSEVEKLKLEKASMVAAIAQLTKEVAQWRTLFAQASDALGKLESQSQETAAKTFVDTTVSELETARPCYKFNPQDSSFTPNTECLAKRAGEKPKP